MTAIAFDTETRGLDWFDPDHRAFLASWADAESEHVADLGDPEEAERFLRALKSADRIIAHNLSFDVHHTREAAGVDIVELGAELEDTDIMSRVLHPEGQRKGERGGHGLKSLASTYLGEDSQESEDVIDQLAKEIGYRTVKTTGAYFDVWRAYPEQLEHYARQDARATYDLWELFQREMDADARRCYELEREVMPVLIRAEQRGVRVDPDVVLRLKAQYESEAERLHDALSKTLGEDALNGAGSEAALLEALQSIGVPLHRRTPTGQLATNAYALQEFEDDYAELGQLRDYRQAQKFLSTYIAPMEGREVIHPSFIQTGAWTGRMSCRRPNMQNIPVRGGAELRSMFVPRPGHVFVVCDYESIEIRLLAWYLADKGYRELIERGLDPHAWMAASIWGGRMEDYAKGSEGEARRSAAKNVLFAITYGAGARRVGDMLKIPPDEAKSLVAKIKSSLTGYGRLQHRIRSKIEREGYVTTLFGRKQPVRKDKAYVGLNALIQGSAADIMKQGLVNVDEAVRPLGAAPLLVVHDEVVVEVPEESAEEALALTTAAMNEACELAPRLETAGSVARTSYAEGK